MNRFLKVSTASLRPLFSLLLLLCTMVIFSPAQAMNFASNESAADDSEPAIGTQAQATNAKLELLIPLYIYPNWWSTADYVWDDVAEASCRVPITVIINPDSGPDDGPPNADYEKGLETLRRGCVKILGYVSTKWGNVETRPRASIEYDINLYHTHFGVDGIFLDEAASGADKVEYYRELYNYIKSKSNNYQVVLNPGNKIDKKYISQRAGDTAVIFEASGNSSSNYYENWLNYKTDPYVSNYPSERFAFLEYDVRDADTMRKHIFKAFERNIKYVYVTSDDRSDDDPWNSLPSYWQQEVDYIEELNNGTSPQPLTCMGHVVTIPGTEGPDTIHGTSGPDVIHGLGGNDTIYGNGGDDIICAGNGGDFVNGNQGNDQIDGGEGWDTLRGGKNDDTINGGPGNDKIYGDLGRDTINGNQGNDSIYGGAGNDTLRGGQNNDFINGNQGNDQVYGDKGNDTLRGGRNNDTINGGNGTDRIYGDRGVDRCSNGPHIFGCER